MIHAAQIAAIDRRLAALDREREELEQRRADLTGMQGTTTMLNRYPVVLGAAGHPVRMFPATLTESHSE